MKDMDTYFPFLPIAVFALALIHALVKMYEHTYVCVLIEISAHTHGYQSFVSLNAIPSKSQ